MATDQFQPSRPPRACWIGSCQSGTAYLPDKADPSLHYPPPPTKTSRARGLLVAIRRITFWIRLNTIQTEGTQVMRKEGYYPSIGVRASVHPSPGCRRQAVLDFLEKTISTRRTDPPKSAQRPRVLDISTAHGPPPHRVLDISTFR